MGRSGSWALHQWLLVWDGAQGAGGAEKGLVLGSELAQAGFLTDKLKDVCGSKGKLMQEMSPPAALGPHPDPSSPKECRPAGLTLGFFNPKNSCFEC